MPTSSVHSRVPFDPKWSTWSTSTGFGVLHWRIKIHPFGTKNMSDVSSTARALRHPAGLTKEAPAKHRPKRQTKSVLRKNAEVSSSAQRSWRVFGPEGFPHTGGFKPSNESSGIINLLKLETCFETTKSKPSICQKKQVGWSHAVRA